MSNPLPLPTAALPPLPPSPTEAARTAPGKGEVSPQEMIPAPVPVPAPAKRTTPARKRKPTRNIRPTDRDKVMLDFIRLASLTTAHHTRRHLLLYPEVWTDGSQLRSNIDGRIPAEVMKPTLKTVRQNLLRLRRAKLVQEAVVGDERIYAITPEGLGVLGYDEEGAGAKRDPYREKLLHTLGVGALVSEVRASARKGVGFFGEQFEGVEDGEIAILTDAFIEKSASGIYAQDIPRAAEKVKLGWRNNEYGEPAFAFADAFAYALYNQDDDGKYRKMIPDLAVVMPGNQKPFAIEFERSTKNDFDKYRTKLLAYQHSPYSDIYYLTTVKAVRDRLTRVLVEQRWVEDSSEEDDKERLAIFNDPHGGTRLHLYLLDKKRDRLYTETLPSLSRTIR